MDVSKAGGTVIASKEIPENIEEIFERCFGEPLRHGKPGRNARIIENGFGWVVFEPIGNVAFIHFAATFPEVRRQGRGNAGFPIALETLAHEGFESVQMVTKRENVAPQILALKNGFLVFGVFCGRDGKLEITWQRSLMRGET